MSLPPLTFGRGACIAARRIVADRAPVRFMYRDRPDGPMDSGWRFFDTPTPTLRPQEADLVDVSLIASLDPTVAPHLDAPVGAAFLKPENAQAFTPIPFSLPS